MWEYKRRVKYYETDRMGVVHHSNYLRLLEDARMDWIGDNIMSYGEMEKLGIVIPFTSSRQTCKGFLRFDEPFRITVRLYKYSGVRMYFHYEIYNDDTDELCFEGETVHYFTVDQENYKPCSIKRLFPEIHDAFTNAVEKDEE